MSTPIDRLRSGISYAGASVAPAALSALDTASIRVLVVDDDRTLREGCANVLHHDGYAVTMIGSGEEALEQTKREPFDIVLVSAVVAGMSGLDILARLHQQHPDALVILMTSAPSVSASMEALRAGAWEYLPKPFTGAQLQVLVGRAAHAVIGARGPVEGQQHRFSVSRYGESATLLGLAPAFRQAVDLARRVAPTSVAVMISGEGGTGKELIAQFIHQQSRRAALPFVATNCATLSDAALEAELFGHRAGAFTGADRDRPGLLEQAHKGTLFLDDLIAMSLPLQAKLLRVVQDGIVQRVGSDERDAMVSVRFISATTRNPQDAARGGGLREDLLYRLRVVPIHLPPLRERLEDIPLLANYFLAQYWRKHRPSRDAAPTLSKASLDALCERRWRGNVRELQNVIEHLAVLAAPGQRIQPQEIPLLDDTLSGTGAAAASDELMEQGFHEAKDRLVSTFEKEYIRRLLARAGGNMSKAARLARVDRTTLYRLADKHAPRESDAEYSAEDAASDNPLLYHTAPHDRRAPGGMPARAD